MSKTSKKKKTNKFSITYVIIFLAILVILVGFSFLRKGFYHAPSENNMSVYSYKADKSANYTVSLKENDFYTTDTLPSKMSYPASALNLINVNFKYDFSSSDLADINYTYDIKADIVGTVKDDDDKNSEIWNRSFIVQSERTNTVNQKNNFLINDDVVIDYNYFNNLATLYEQSYGFNVEVILKVRLQIKYHIDLADKNIDDEEVSDYIELTMPLATNVTRVNENYTEATKDSLMPHVEEKKNSPINKVFIIFGTGLIALGILVIALNINSRKYTKKDLYRKNINSILKDYSDLVVSVVNKPNISGLKTMRLSNIDDLVDVAEQRNDNIVLYERIKDKESDLYVICNNYVYIYTVTYAELRKK